MDRYELSVLAKEKLTDSSRQQLQSASNAKFMILDQKNHFERICKKSTHPVHLLRRQKDGKLKWMKSKGDMDNLRKYINQEQDELDEGQFCQVCDSQSNPVLICDTPGMGKSVLLAQMGHRLIQLHPDRTVHFMVLSEFTKLAKTFGTEDKLKMIELTLQELTGKDVLQSKLNLDEDTVSIELLLDGFDEVDSNDRTSALEILQTIAKSFRSIRLWITSRPHFMTELENSLNILGYNIRPLHEENQVYFLSSFWSRNAKLDQAKVQLFAKHCLKSLNATMNSTDNDIAGLPLQCLLIGEVYQDDAMEYARRGRENVESSPPPEIDIGTITNLYRQLIHVEKYKSAFGNGKLREEELMTIHYHRSLEVLYPYSHETLGLPKAREIDIGDAMKVGILTSTHTGDVTFLHRTFAEYFMALFIIDKLQQEDEWTPALVNFGLLAMRERFINLLFSPHQHQIPVNCYFLNSMMADIQIDILPDYYPSTIYSWQLQSLETIVWTCLKDDFVQIFKLFDKRRAFNKLPGEFYDDELLLFGVRHSSVELVKSVLAHFERHHDFDLEVQTATLREAVKRGKFSILEFLIKDKGLGGIVENLEDNLVCGCVAETMGSSDGEINEKILILRMLVGIKGSLVDDPGGTSVRVPPLLSQGVKRVHVRLLLELVRLGANVFVQNHVGQTVLHFSNLYYYGYHCLPVCLDFDEVEARDDYHELITGIPIDHLKKMVHILWNTDTALMALLRCFDPLQETLQEFHDAGADFNHVNRERDSILAVAIMSGRNAGTIRKLVHLGAQVNWPPLTYWLGFRRRTLLHNAARFGNLEAVGVQCKIKVNAKDENGQTPLDHAIHSIIFDRQISSKDKRLKVCLKIFENGGSFNKTHELMGERMLVLHTAVLHNYESVRLLAHFGLDVDGIDKQGNTPLHLVAQYPYSSYFLLDRYSIIQHLIENGANPYALNHVNETPFHALLKNEDRDFRVFRLFKSIWDEKSLWTPTVATLALGYAVRGDEEAFADEDFEGLAGEFEAHGGDFNWRDVDGNSLLHFAVKNGKIRKVKVLCEKGVDVNSKNSLGETPLLWASISYRKTPLKITMCLIENGANPTDVADSGDNILHFAACGAPSALLYFLEFKGVNVNGKGSNGNTPLHCALDHRNRSIVNGCLLKCGILVENGADVNILNWEGYSPLGMAMMRKDSLLIGLLRSSKVKASIGPRIP